MNKDIFVIKTKIFRKCSIILHFLNIFVYLYLRLFKCIFVHLMFILLLKCSSIKQLV